MTESALIRRIYSVVVPLSIALCGAAAWAQKPPQSRPGEEPSASSAQPESAEAEARERFDKGRKLLVQGAFAAALPEFLESRRLFPSRAATSSAAVCLRTLQRYDEALALMEALLREFTDLPADVKTAAQAQIVELRALVGTIEIAGVETGTTVLVDGRIKGEHPLLAPLRVPAGSHLLRFYKEGFETQEVRAEVKGQDVAAVVVRLKRLVESGKLRVEEATGKKLEVVIDGTVVGATPWEGPVAVGEHSVNLRGSEDTGTLPKAVTIQRNKDANLSLAAEKLDATLRIAPKPVDASVAVDGIFVGRGAFEGRVRPGAHKVKVIADGYFAAERPINAERGADNAIAIDLERDPSSPAWRAPGRFSVEAAGAFAFSPSFGGDVAECSACEAGAVLGGGAVLNAGFETWTKFSFGASVGYLLVRQSVEDRATELQVIGGAPDQGKVTDDLTLRAFQVGVWGAYRIGPERFPVRMRLGAGALLGTVSDRRTGAFRVGGQAGECAFAGGALTDAGCFAVGPLAEAPFASFFYVAPELRAGYRLSDSVELSVGVQALISFGLTRPRWNSDSPLPNQDHPVNASPDGYGTFASETLTGVTQVIVVPGASVRYEF